MIEIDSMSIALPAGFEVRAASIARLAAAEIGRGIPRRSGRIARVDAGSVSLRAGASDGEVARAIAGAVHASMRRAR